VPELEKHVLKYTHEVAHWHCHGMQGY